MPFSVDLPEAIGNLVALSAVGDVDVTVNGTLHLGIGLDFDEFDDPANLFFVKGDSRSICRPKRSGRSSC